jgi:hypothetical protein
MRVGITAAALIAALIMASSAEAARGTYAGTVSGTTGKIAVDVKIKNGIVTKVTHVRGKAIPSTCEISGPIPEISFDQAASLAVKPNGKFSGSYTQPTYGNVSTLSGKIKHKHMSGTLQVNAHYPAEGPYPEENCDTGPLAFNAKFGATDETVTTTPRLVR